MHQIDDARRLDDARFDVSPRCPSTGAQSFAANIACVGFGGSCFGDRHEEKMIDAAEKCEPLAGGCVTGSPLHRPVICSSLSGYRAPCTVIFDAASSISRMQPSPRAETSKLLFPSLRFCIIEFFL